MSKGLLNAFKGNSFSVGVPYYEGEIFYHQEEIDIKKGDFLYLFTDGIVDQFGGDKNKKFLGKRLKSLISEISNRSSKMQQRSIQEAMSNWMEGCDQVDDMLLIGVKL